MRTAQPTVVIEEILDRTIQGVTEPFICRGDDGQVYFVKGRSAGRRSLVCEWVASQVATALGLPIAGYVVAEVPEQLLAYKVRSDLGDLGSGLVFASRQLPHVQELSLTTRDLVPPELARDVLVFDWWVRNEDRHLTARGGNPNLLWDVAADELVVIDHNQAFDRDFRPGHFLESHVFADYWNEVFGDHDLRATYVGRMETVLRLLDSMRASIPGSWWWVDDGVPADVSWDELLGVLTRCRQPDFWNIP